MSGFQDREQAFENKFGHDEELEFKITARMGHFFGLWAAEQLGLKNAEAEAYAKTCVDADLKKPGQDDLLDKVEADFKEKGFTISRHRMEREIEVCRAKARGEICK